MVKPGPDDKFTRERGEEERADGKASRPAGRVSRQADTEPKEAAAHGRKRA